MIMRFVRRWLCNRSIPGILDNLPLLERFESTKSPISPEERELLLQWVALYLGLPSNGNLYFRIKNQRTGNALFGLRLRGEIMLGCRVDQQTISWEWNLSRWAKDKGISLGCFKNISYGMSFGILKYIGKVVGDDQYIRVLGSLPDNTLVLITAKPPNPDDPTAPQASHLVLWKGTYDQLYPFRVNSCRHENYGSCMINTEVGTFVDAPRDKPHRSARALSFDGKPLLPF